MGPISDFFTRIKNGYRAAKETVIVPHSAMKEAMARVLESRGYLAGVEKKGRKVRKFLELELSYEGKTPGITHVRLLSKPSRRIYVKARQIRPVRQGFGLLILSTPQGIMSGEDARKARVGGEAIAEVW